MNKIPPRNGDWTFFPTKELPKGEKIEIKSNQFVFAVGEATNHNHTAIVSRVTDMEWFKMPDGSYYVNFKKEARITHPEHSLKKDLIIPIGTYKVVQRREKDWYSLTTRKIQD